MAPFVGLATSKRDECPIVIDTGASTTLTPFRSDFIEFTPCQSEINAVGSSQKVQGHGIVEFDIIDMNNIRATIRTHAILCESSDIRLFSPQQYFQECNDGLLVISKDVAHLTSPHLDFKFPFHPSSHLPVMLPATSSVFLRSLCYTINQDLCANLIGDPLACSGGTLDFTPQRGDAPALDHLFTCIAETQHSHLSSAQKELLSWHQKFGHVFMHRLQRMLHRQKPLDQRSTSEELCHPVVVRSRRAETRTCVPPKCTACLLAKSQRKSSHPSSLNPEKFHALSKGVVEPGHRVSMDQFTVTHKGRRPGTANPPCIQGFLLVRVV